MFTEEHLCKSVRSVGDLRPLLFFHGFELFFVESADGYGTATEVEDELAVAGYAYDVAFVALEEAGEDAKLDVVARKFLKRFAEEGDLLRVVAECGHKRTHRAVGDGSGNTAAAVVNEMIVGIVFLQELLQPAGCTAKKDESAKGGTRFLLRPSVATLLLIDNRAVNKTLVCIYGIGLVEARHLFFERKDVAVAHVEITPGQFFFSRDLLCAGFGNTDALWQTVVCVGCRK